MALFLESIRDRYQYYLLRAAADNEDSVTIETTLEDVEKRKSDLRHKLERRPTRDELVQVNILKGMY